MKPTTDDILAFAATIGVHDMYISERYNKPGDVLHELAHNAVCTDEQLNSRTPRDPNDLRKGYLIPDIRTEVGTNFGRGYKPGRTSPNEYGARVWALEVLEYFGWETPDNTGNPHIYSGTPDSKGDGEQQLRQWGIEPLKGIFRPLDNPVTPAL
jgi:hypothetical protein